MSHPHQPLDPRKVLAEAIAGLQQDAGADAGRGLPPAPTTAELAPVFPDYRIAGLIGRGGMGAVYRAHPMRLGRDVALKILPKHLAADPVFAERFLREARALARLDHPHILRVFDFGEAAGWCYLVTEFVDGANLRQLMQLGRVTPTEALRLVPQMCDALQYAHGRGVVHRDIKPENILVDTAGNVKVADFGLAKLLGVDAEVNLTLTTQLIGTPHYMAPEQIERPSAVDHRADIFSLGVVFYEMLTGKLPLGRFAPPSASGAATEGIDPVVMKSLEREPGRRYQAAADMQRDLAARRSNDGTARPAIEELRKRRVARLLRSQQQPMTATVALVVGFVGFFGPVLWQSDQPHLLGIGGLLIASILGFRGLALPVQPAPAGQVALVVAAWFPLLLLLTMLAGGLLEPLLAPSDAAGLAFWAFALLFDVLVVGWLAVQHLARQRRQQERGARR